jgi:hypothetical protein
MAGWYGRQAKERGTFKGLQHGRWQEKEAVLAGGIVVAIDAHAFNGTAKTKRYGFFAGWDVTR